MTIIIRVENLSQTYIKQKVLELNLSKQVHFLGFVPQEHLTILYRKAFALTFLSFFGSDNLPPLEAFALSCPVIASNVSGAQEQLGDAALLVEPTNVEQIALAIKSIWEDNNLRQTLIQRGSSRASQWTTTDNTARIRLSCLIVISVETRHGASLHF